MVATDTAVAAPALNFDSAAAIATRLVPIVRPETSAKAIRHYLLSTAFDSAAHIVVCDGDRFLGIFPIEILLAAEPQATAQSLMDPQAPLVGPGLDQEVAAWRAVRHRESALAVVDTAQRFIGLIPPHRLLAVLMLEHDEDLTRLGGFLHDTATARSSSLEPVPRRFWHRVPWLLLGFAGALLAAHIVGRFELALQQQVMLAFFLPGIVYLADAVGTQTETVVVRGLSVGVGMRVMFWRELLTGLAIGLALSVVAYPVLWLLWGQSALAWGVTLALLAACATATISAMLLPWLLHRAGLDPAFGSGPLATVIQDLLSILLYFVIVTAILSP